MKHKKNIAEEKIMLARMIKDFGIYTIQEIQEKGLEHEEFITIDNKFALKYVASYERKGRRDKNSDGKDKPRVKVNGFFRKLISLNDHRELYKMNKSLTEIEHKIHHRDSQWHDEWKERVSDFCETEKRFYPDGIPSKSGYRIADAYYTNKNTVIEFQKSFSDEALNKSIFYKNENVHLIWLFYLQSLEVFKDDNKYKIREDNFYHFFRIEDIIPSFYEDNFIFIQDKNDRIYHVEKIHRVESDNELEATVRYFNIGLKFNNPNEFVKWLQYDWQNSSYYKEHSLKEELKSIDEILSPFKDSDEKMFYLQNCTKNDINGYELIYCFIKDEEGFRKKSQGYISYRCYTSGDGYYHPNVKWDHTFQNPKSKKWILLATNCKKYRDKVDL